MAEYNSSNLVRLSGEIYAKTRDFRPMDRIAYPIGYPSAGRLTIPATFPIVAASYRQRLKRGCGGGLVFCSAGRYS